MGLRRALKRITKGLRKAIKSPVGKLLLAGAAIYAGGQIFGKAAGAAGGGAAGATEAAGTVATEAAGKTAAQEMLTEGAGKVAAEGAKKGFLNRAITGIGNFVEKNPMASSMAFNAVASALSPDEMDILHEQEKMRRQRYQDMAVPGSVGFSVNPRGILNQGVKV